MFNLSSINMFFIPTLAVLGMLIVFFSILLVIQSIKAKGQVTRSLNMKLFSIRLPKNQHKEGDQQKPEKETISVAEQMYAGLSSIRIGFWKRLVYGPSVIALEVALPEVGEEIAFYIAMPHKWAPVIEKQIHGIYSQAEIEDVPEDYNIFNSEGVVMGSRLSLKKDYIFPIKTYQDLEVDPLSGITTALSKLEAVGEGAAIQILIIPERSRWQKKSFKITKGMQQGKSYTQAWEQSSSGLGYVSKAIFGDSKNKENQKEEKNQQEKKMTPFEEESIKFLERKAGKIGFRVNIRLVSSALTEIRASQILEQLENAFIQFTNPNCNEFKIKRLKRGELKKMIYDYSLRIFRLRHSFIFNTEELTSIYHLPTNMLLTPKVQFVRAKSAEAPINLPKEGIILGINKYRGVENVIRITDNDRRRHLYIIGQTGTGKSYFMKSMIAQDIEAGKGVCVIDPHGDLVNDVLTRVPKERADDVIVFDPAQLDRPIGLNMLEYDPKYPEQKTFVVNELINIFNQLYDMKTAGGPMFEHYTRNALMLLMDDPNEKFTLMEVPKVMADAEFRKRLLLKCKNITVKDFWEKEAEKAGGDVALQNIVPYITSKFNVFTTNDYMQPIVGQKESGLNFREIIDQGKILLVNLSKGRLGDINSSLIGLIVVGKLLMASLSRVDIPEEQRRDFYLYIDEFQNVSTESIATILSEARKYRLNLVVAHQFIAQLKEPIKNAVFGNVGSMACFRVGAEDAKFLENYFKPNFTEQDLINIDNANTYVKLIINGQASQAFNMQTNSFTKGNGELSKDLIELSKLKYGRDRETVMQGIAERQRR